MAQTQSKTEAAALRKFLNKREDIAVQILAGLSQNPNIMDVGFTLDPKDVANYAVETADALLQKLYIHEDKAATE